MNRQLGHDILDADSHILEMPNFLTVHADHSIRDRLPSIDARNAGLSRAAWTRASCIDDQPAAMKRGGHAPATVQELEKLGSDLLAGPKGFHALGAFNSVERSSVLDALGIRRQLVFPTFSPNIAFNENLQMEVRYGAAQAHNRGMAAFCEDDTRLVGVALLPLDDPQLAADEMSNILGLGLGAIWVPHRRAGSGSPGHRDLDPVWAAMAEAGLPFVLHVGG